MVYCMYLNPEDYCYKYKVNASFVIDVKANLREVSVTGLQLPRSCLSFNFSFFSRPVPSIRQIIFLTCIQNVLQRKALREGDAARWYQLSIVQLSQEQCFKKMETFWPPNNNKPNLEKLI